MQQDIAYGTSLLALAITFTPPVPETTKIFFAAIIGLFGAYFIISSIVKRLRQRPDTSTE